MEKQDPYKRNALYIIRMQKTQARKQKHYVFFEIVL